MNTVQLHSLSFSNTRTYLFATLFVLGNMALPQLVHLVPQGGMIWLPIYFFTLVGAYKYGWRVGMLTALASPVVNSLLFDMPAVAALPAIMLKSVLLAAITGFVAHRFHKVSLLLAAWSHRWLSGIGHSRRMGHEGRSHSRMPGFPHRHPRHAGTALWRLCRNQISYSQIMKVLSINGSPHLKGCTNRALEEVERTLNAQGIETVRVNVGNKDIRGCIACLYCREHGECVFHDPVNDTAPTAFRMRRRADRFAHLLCGM